MTIDFTKPVQTRDGQPVTILTTTRKRTGYPVVGIDDQGDIFTFTIEGKFYNDGRDHEMDLMNVPVKHTREVWINLYPEERDTGAHETKEIADKYASTTRIACIPVTIEFEEGEGL